MSPQSETSSGPGWHATTILSVRKAGQVVMAGDGQVSMGQTVVKANAKKVRRLGNGQIVGGLAGSTADAFTLFERLEAKLERHPGQLLRAAIELAKDWRTDRYLRRLEAMMAVADKDVSLLLSGSSTSPVPVRTSVVDLSATIIIASRRRRSRSGRQSLASSTAARVN